MICLATASLFADPVPNPPYRVTLSTAAPPPYGDISVTAESDKKDSQRLRSLLVDYGEFHVSVSEKALSDAGPVLMNTWDILTERDNHGRPWIYLYVESPYRLPDGRQINKRIHFLICEGKFKSLYVETPIDESSMNFKMTDY